MASKDYIPHKDRLFHIWQNNFVNGVNENYASWDLPARAATEWTLLTATPGTKKMRWDAAWANVSTNNFTRSQNVEMNDARREYESGFRISDSDTSLRLFIKRYLRNNPLVTNPQRIQIGITIPDEDKSGPLDKNALIDLWGLVRSVDHLVHLIQVTVPGRRSRAKGRGVKDIQVFMAITPASQTASPSLSSFAYIGVVKRGLMIQLFSEDQVGMRAHYYARFRFEGKIDSYGPPSSYWSCIIM